MHGRKRLAQACQSYLRLSQLTLLQTDWDRSPSAPNLQVCADRCSFLEAGGESGLHPASTQPELERASTSLAPFAPKARPCRRLVRTPREAMVWEGELGPGTFSLPERGERVPVPGSPRQPLHAGEEPGHGPAFGGGTLTWPTCQSSSCN